MALKIADTVDSSGLKGFFKSIKLYRVLRLSWLFLAKSVLLAVIRCDTSISRNDSRSPSTMHSSKVSITCSGSLSSGLENGSYAVKYIVLDFFRFLDIVALAIFISSV